MNTFGWKGDYTLWEQPTDGEVPVTGCITSPKAKPLRACSLLLSPHPSFTQTTQAPGMHPHSSLTIQCGFRPSKGEHAARSCHSLPSGHGQSTHSRTGTIGHTLLTAATQSQDNRSAFKLSAGISQSKSCASHVIGLDLMGQKGVFLSSNCSVFCQISTSFYLPHQNKKKLPISRNTLWFKYNLARLTKDDDWCFWTVTLKFYELS